MAKLLFLLDDIHRYEKKQLIEQLNQSMEFTLASHDKAVVQEFPDNNCIEIVQKKARIYEHKILNVLYSLFVKQSRINYKGIQFQKVRNKLMFYEGGIFEKIKVMYRYFMTGLNQWFFGYFTAFQIYQLVFPRQLKAYDWLSNYDILLYSAVSRKDDKIIFEARRRGLKTICWFYSWDNPFKDLVATYGADYYFVWNEQNQKDVMRLFDANKDNVIITGPIQFDYLFEKPLPMVPLTKKRYILFSCASSTPYLIEQEVQMIKECYQVIQCIDPDVRLMVRPYPFFANKNKSWELYAQLSNYKQIDFEPHYKENDFSKLTKTDFNNKIEQMKQAICCVNYGSTTILEQAFSNRPIFQIMFDVIQNSTSANKKCPFTTVFQYDHQQYVLTNAPNIIQSKDDLSHYLKRVLDGNESEYMGYSKELQKFADPIPNTTSYKKNFCDTINQLIKNQ